MECSLFLGYLNKSFYQFTVFNSTKSDQTSLFVKGGYNLAHDPPISLPESPAPSLTFPLPYPFSQFFTLITLFYHMLLQTSQIASDFAAYFCVFKLISSITSSLADDDYKIVIESFQRIIIIVVFHSCSL